MFDISLGNRVAVVNREAHVVSTPVVLEQDGFISFEFKWQLTSSTQITRVGNPYHPTVGQRNEIEQIYGEINLDFSVRALDGFESTMGNLRIVDVGNVFRRIFELLGFMSTDIYVEIRFHGKILTFSLFKLSGYPGNEKQSEYYEFFSNPMIEVDQYVASLLKLETLSTDDFRVSIVLSFGRYDKCDDTSDEDDANSTYPSSTDVDSKDDES